ncbi:hypothetical protein Tco_0285597 [Tanacetum coccineum]
MADLLLRLPSMLEAHYKNADSVAYVWVLEMDSKPAFALGCVYNSNLLKKQSLFRTLRNRVGTSQEAARCVTSLPMLLCHGQVDDVMIIEVMAGENSKDGEGVEEEEEEEEEGGDVAEVANTCP